MCIIPESESRKLRAGDMCDGTEVKTLLCSIGSIKSEKKQNNGNVSHLTRSLVVRQSQNSREVLLKEGTVLAIPKSHSRGKLGNPFLLTGFGLKFSVTGWEVIHTSFSRQWYITYRWLTDPAWCKRRFCKVVLQIELETHHFSNNGVFVNIQKEGFNWSCLGRLHIDWIYCSSEW